MSQTPLDKILQFRKAFNLPIRSGFMSTAHKLQLSLLREELEELECGYDKFILGVNTNQPAVVREAKEEILDGILDLIYVAYGYVAELGLDFDEAFGVVHDSNMSKLGADGKPIYNEHGKVQKGPNFKEPALWQFVNRIDFGKPAPIDIEPESAPAAESERECTSVIKEANHLITGPRAETYNRGETTSYTNFSEIAELWSWWLNDKLRTKITASDVAQMMSLLKKARMRGATQRDNTVDDIGYSALYWENLTIEQDEQPNPETPNNGNCCGCGQQTIPRKYGKDEDQDD